MKAISFGRALLVAAAIIIGAGATALPASAVSTVQANGDRSVDFTTAFEPTLFGGGEYAGVMHVSISHDGIIQGWYRDEDEPGYVDVEGGLTGNQIWLDVGRRWHLTGTFDGSTIEASTFLGRQPWTFTGKSGR